MKRMRDDITNQNNNMDDLGMTPPPSSLWASMSPCKSQHASTKRYRDRSVPIDALSCLMSAAVTNARMKKHSSITRLFAGKIEASRVCVAVCECGKCQFEPSMKVYCRHCDRQMGNCCSRECDACCHSFCSLCSTLNCDEQLDRVFCLSCNEEGRCRK